VLLIGAAAAAAVALVYAPLFSQLVDQTEGYADAFGNQFSSPVDVVETIATYLLDLNRNPLLLLTWAAALVAPALVVLPARIERGPFRGVRRRLAVFAPQPIRQLVRILVGAAISVFAIALILTTPPQRTIAFVVVAIAFATVVSLAALRDDPRVGRAAAGLMVVAGVLGCVHAVAANATFSHLAIQDWEGAADYIDDTFPDGMPVFAVTQSDWLSAYLDTDAHPVVRSLDEQALRDGELVVSAFDSTDRNAQLGEQVRTAPNLVEVTLEQRGQGDRGHGYADPPKPFPLLFAPPLDPLVDEVTIDGTPAPDLVDRTLGTGPPTGPQDGLAAPVEVVVRVPAGTIARSLVLAVAPDHFPRELDVQVTAADG
jgi:hypothetical protein